MANAPFTLSAESPDGTRSPVIREGAALPASGRVMFATTRAGQTEAVLRLFEADRLLAEAVFELPRGMPPNTWIAIHLRLDEDLRVRAEARENLRRLRAEADFDETGAEAERYTV